jgi:hypothetical protein
MNDEEGEFRKELLFFCGIWFAFNDWFKVKESLLKSPFKTKNKVFYAFSILQII